MSNLHTLLAAQGAVATLSQVGLHTALRLALVAEAGMAAGQGRNAPAAADFECTVAHDAHVGQEDLVEGPVWRLQEPTNCVADPSAQPHLQGLAEWPTAAEDRHLSDDPAESRGARTECARSHVGHAGHACAASDVHQLPSRASLPGEPAESGAQDGAEQAVESASQYVASNPALEAESDALNPPSDGASAPTLPALACGGFSTSSGISKAAGGGGSRAPAGGASLGRDARQAWDQAPLDVQED
eukprot:CAMPEP_0195130862 /NCGR_PEP_ID=MMETSP0448-20130528/143996_2 /TAXON_ID=66468 /ORGANISM="Heterocapsa triquestra, Strain CCMP 448" /LENGTH=243 /DNA_ID=CAMNT_0040168787 /DNA_START=23 /DNA_END=751 /DNA_ORIENTATION=-